MWYFNSRQEQTEKGSTVTEQNIFLSDRQNTTRAKKELNLGSKLKAAD